MWPKNCWYVAAWPHEFGCGALVARTVLDEAIVLFRTDGGEVAALADRCCHRFAPLSKGRREGDFLRCMYHGLKFDVRGRCVEIPGQTVVPPQASVRSYPVVVKQGWVWIWMGDPLRADPALLPDSFPLDHPQWRAKPDYLHYKANYQLIHDNLLDFSHLSYVHPGTLGGAETIAENVAKVEQLDSGVRVTRWLIDDVPAPFHTAVANFTGNVDRWHIYDFVVPGILLMHSGVQATGTGAPDGHVHDALEFRSCHAVTPETASTTHYFWAVPHNFRIDDAAVTNKIHEIASVAFLEDRGFIEAQQRVIDRTKGVAMVPIVHDKALTMFRRTMQRLIDAEKKPDRSAAGRDGNHPQPAAAGVTI